ncbi:MAG TPA: hypothetical protein VNI83_03395 [Vicinamibacterales bacterium]|nr:hypothetical protein [Vicinamibacterales bacterium]
MAADVRRPASDPTANLERAFIDEYLRSQGVDPGRLGELPEARRHHLLKAASIYAAARLTEVEARAHYVDEIHGRRE